MIGINKEPSAIYNISDGMSVPILYEVLRDSVAHMSVCINACSVSESPFIEAIKFLNYSKIAINTIPTHKIQERALVESVKKEWESLFAHLYQLSKAPHSQRLLTFSDLLRLHALYGDIMKCIDASGLGWGNFFTIATKSDTIRNYMQKGR